MTTAERILDYISSYSSEKGYPPTVREIGEHVGLSSSATVHKYLDALYKAGRLTKVPGIPRTLRVVR